MLHFDDGARLCASVQVQTVVCFNPSALLCCKSQCLFYHEYAIAV